MFLSICFHDYNFHNYNSSLYVCVCMCGDVAVLCPPDPPPQLLWWDWLRPLLQLYHIWAPAPQSCSPRVLTSNCLWAKFGLVAQNLVAVVRLLSRGVWSLATLRWTGTDRFTSCRWNAVRTLAGVVCLVNHWPRLPRLLGQCCMCEKYRVV